MKKMNFPIIKETLPRTRRLTLEDFLKFISFYQSYVLDKKAYRNRKKKTTIDVRFSL